MKGSIVLKNKKNEVVRTIHGNTSTFYIIYRMDTHRIEHHNSLKELDKNKVDYVEVSKVNIKDLQKKPIQIAKIGTLELVENIDALSTDIETKEENDENFKKALKWVLVANIAFLCFSFLLSFVLKYFNPPQEVQVVTIEPRSEELKRPVVSPTEKRHRPKVAKRVAKKPKIVAKHKTPTRNMRKSHARSKSRTNINHVGALAALGSLSKSATNGGLNVNKIQTSKGAGMGGSQGSGGVQSAFYGKGLVGAALGPGHNVKGAGGYGTRGKGGGKAGYGRMSLSGASGAFFHPVEEEALIDGGLDRDEINAVIQRHLGQVRFCYEQGLQSEPDLAGRVAIKFVIGSRGHVNVANIANSSLRSRTVESCLVNKLKGWKFPEPRGGVDVKVSYPFVLKRASRG